MKRRKIPMRKCVASGEMLPKRELIRVVRSQEGEVSIDQTGKQPGRGAYLSKDKACIEKAKQRNILGNHLKVEIDDSIYEDLIALADKENK